MYVCVAHVCLVSAGINKSPGSPGAAVTDVCELPHGTGTKSRFSTKATSVLFLFYFGKKCFFLGAEEKIQWLKALGVQTGGPEFGSAPLPQNQGVAR